MVPVRWDVARSMAAVATLCVIGACTPRPARATPPRVVSTVPASGAVEVASGPSEIRVIFDQEMAQGSHSFVGGGPSFPTLAGQPRWIDGRTCLLHVALEADRFYSVGINGAGFTGFRNARGEAAPPSRVMFATAPGPGSPALSPEANRAALEVLRRAIDERYSHRDRLGLDWPRLFATSGPAVVAARGRASFALAVARLLEPARDIHIWVELGGPIPTFERSVEPNYSFEVVSRLVPGLVQRSAVVWSGRMPDGVGYLLITSFERGQAAALAAAGQALDELASAPGLVLDVRPNSGGDESLAREVASRFIQSPAVYARHQFRQPGQPGGFAPMQERSIGPAVGRSLYSGPVAVLMGPANMSSAEAFLLMMAQAPRAALVGARSYGASGNPQPVDLGNGVRVHLPSWRAFDPAGAPLEGVGIRPALEVPLTAADLAAGRDPVLQAGLNAVRAAGR